jgi:hypothetical protein
MIAHGIRKLLLRSMKSLTLSLLALAVICPWGCRVTDSSPKKVVKVAGEMPPAASNLKAVAGSWIFEDLGPSTVEFSPIQDPARLTRQRLSEARISIGEDGNTELLLSGKTAAFRLALLEETSERITVGVPEAPREEAWVYEKSTRLLTWPVEVNVDGKKGTMPAYFRRQ